MADSQKHQAARDSLSVAVELKSVIDQHAAVDITDLGGTIVEVNDRFCELFQFARTEVIGRSHRLLSSGHHPPEFFAVMWSKISNGAVWRGNIRNRARDGSDRWVDTTIVPLFDGHDEPRRYFAIRTDITDRQQTRQALQVREAQLRLALQGANAAAWQWNMETGEATWSPEVFLLHGLEPGSRPPSYKTWLEAIHPEDRARAEADVEAALVGRATGFSSEYRVVLPSCEVRWLSALGTVERTSAGAAVRMSGIMLDITERKTADIVLRAGEAALRQSQARLRHAADAARLTYAEFDLVANRGAAADNYARVMGYSPLKPDGTLEVGAALARLVSHVAPEDRRFVQERIGAALSGKHPTVDAEYRVIGDDGAVRWIRSVGLADLGANGRPERIFVTNLDVTKQVEVREALRKATEKADEILSSIADGFCAIDSDWRVVYFNDTAEELLKLPRADALGRPFFEVFPSLLGTAVHDGFRRVMEERAPLQFEAALPGSMRCAFFSTYPTREGGFSVHFRDISDRKRIETEIVNARNEAERANMAKSRFLAAASHDLRQPVQSLMLFMSLAERQVADNPQAKATLEMMQKALDGLHTLLNAILDISRFDAGLEAQVEPVDVAAMLRRLVIEYRGRADELGLDLRLSARVAWASADPALLERAVRNLIANAIRYTPAGGVLIGLRRRGGRVRIDVVDTGIGVPPDRQSEIFEEFVQLGNPGRQLGLGLGLGLAIVSRIARLHGGSVEVNSREGRGSRFSLLLPAAEPARPAPDQVPGQSDSGGRVLIVEDNVTVLCGLEAALSAWGYETVATASGEEALRRAEADSWRFGAIVADQHLGAGLTGVNTAKEIVRRSGRAVPALILTGDTTREGLNDIAASGFAFMHKPIASEALRQNIARLIRA